MTSPTAPDESLRRVLAAIQRARPGTFARISEDAEATVAVEVTSEEEVGSIFAERCPDSIAVGRHLLTCGASPEDLVRDVPPPPTTGILEGQVVVVSGAASGLGKGLARGFLDAGACVCGTDIDGDGLAAVAAEWDLPARYATARVDVTDETSVAAGFDAALGRFGKIDAIACAAGVAPPFNLVDFPLAKWRLALEINLTGYFLFGREAARIFQAQDNGGAMVLLSSKSGLEPSKANSAYNATKAGELHLARGWALELGRDGIRVNSIAPGNVFEGSKIWNPEYMKKAAEKKGIQPDEVIPYYNSLTALNAEIKPTDIANAAVFLLSDQARRITGQVLVVDSGQVWTR